MTTCAPWKSRKPIGVFKMKIANANWRIMPQITVRQGKRLRLLESSHAHARSTTSPRALINCSGICPPDDEMAWEFDAGARPFGGVSKARRDSWREGSEELNGSERSRSRGA